eukprot:GHRR01006574.1.p3 GENE.GHRR01006574.1~~GHRR01006574.1.p3  ORF type:complete len:142 (+),score=37.91 GHRR01006574.1:1007-1432(+)
MHTMVPAKHLDASVLNSYQVMVKAHHKNCCALVPAQLPNIMLCTGLYVERPVPANRQLCVLSSAFLAACSATALHLHLMCACSLSIDCDVLKQEATKRLKGNDDDAVPKKKKLVSAPLPLQHSKSLQDLHSSSNLLATDHD